MATTTSRGVRGISAPASFDDYNLMADAAGDPSDQDFSRATLHDDAGVRTRAQLSEEQHWQFRNTTAFWASLFFLQGSVLFTIGSIAMFPGVLKVCPDVDDDDPDETNCQPAFIRKAWVDYSFMIGSMAYFIGNYTIYFQVINSDNNPSLCFIKTPNFDDWGQIAAIINLVGSICYNTNALLPVFDHSRHNSILYDYNLIYVCLGGVGSVFFAIGSCVGGEYNNWR